MSILQKLKRLLPFTHPYHAAKRAEKRASAKQDRINRAATGAWLAKGDFSRDQLDLSVNAALATYVSPTRAETSRSRVQKIARTAAIASAAIGVAGMAGIFGTFMISSVLATYAVTVFNLGALSSLAALATKAVFKKIDDFTGTNAGLRHAAVEDAMAVFAEQTTASATPACAARLKKARARNFNAAAQRAVLLQKFARTKAAGFKP